jgi:hypothetical protein
MRIRSIIIPGLALTVLAVAGCSSVKTDADQTALHYQDGMFSARKYASVVGPSKRDVNGPGDKYFLYPIGQRSYDATGGPGAEHVPYTSSSSDSVEMSTPLSVTFELKTDPVSLKRFHELIGIKYQAWYEENTKDPTGVSAGWGKLLEFYIGQSIDTTLDRVMAGEKWRDSYGKADVRNTIQSTIQSELPASVAAKMQASDIGGYFQNFAVQVQRPVPTNTELLKNIADAQNNVAAAEAAKAKADADVKTANAQLALQKAQAAKKATDISAYGSVDQYNKAQAIEKGINPYQPTYIVPGTQPSK